MATASKEFFRYRFLLSRMPQNALTAMVRQTCIPEDAANLGLILQAWSGAAERMAALALSESGLAESISLADPPPEVQARLKEIRNGHLFRETFSALPTEFKLVEIDKLVAPQREVNLDFVDSIRKQMQGLKAMELVELCLGTGVEPEKVKTLQSAPGQIVYSSRNPDLRFLGGFPKPVTEVDIVAAPGGQPVEAVTLLAGFGSIPLNTYQAGSRVVLANGFHRAVALRMEGVTHVPAVVQMVRKAELGFPDPIMGQPRQYLLQDPRPVLMKDFFDDQLTFELRLKPRRKTVKISWRVEESFVPE